MHDRVRQPELVTDLPGDGDRGSGRTAVMAEERQETSPGVFVPLLRPGNPHTLSETIDSVGVLADPFRQAVMLVGPPSRTSRRSACREPWSSAPSGATRARASSPT